MLVMNSILVVLRCRFAALICARSPMPGRGPAFLSPLTADGFVSVLKPVFLVIADCWQSTFCGLDSGDEQGMPLRDVCFRVSLLGLAEDPAFSCSPMLVVMATTEISVSQIGYCLRHYNIFNEYI